MSHDPNIRSYCNLNCVCLSKNNQNKLINLILRLKTLFPFLFLEIQKTVHDVFYLLSTIVIHVSEYMYNGDSWLGCS